MPGKVYLVGAGPGDPGLLTLKGKWALEHADCVVYDFLANEELLAHTRPACERICAGKRAGRHSITQERLSRMLVEKAQAGSVVVRLKGGDPFVFGRGGEEAAALAEAGIPYEIVPGVSSAYAVPAYAGIPVTQRGWSSSVSILSWRPDSDEGAEQPLRANAETLVFLMGARSLPRIAQMLMDDSRDPGTPVAVIRWGTQPRQEVVTGTLKDIAAKAQSLAPPTVVVVGQVVNLRKQLQWYERLPLFGKRVVITRAEAQAGWLKAALAERGALPVSLPLVEVRAPESWEPLDEALRRVDEFDYLLVTSVNGVRSVLERLRRLGKDVRAFKGIEIGAIGPATAAEFETAGIRVDFVPPVYQAEGLLEVLGGRELTGKSFLIPRARVARDVVPDSLRKRGAHVEVVEAYFTAAPRFTAKQLESLFRPLPDVVTFTSSSTVRNFVKLPLSPNLRKSLATCKTASIGPVTSETLRQAGFAVDIEAHEATIPSLVAAVEAYFRL
jgi:uroporphyrinogen III methyltransferase / synthase